MNCTPQNIINLSKCFACDSITKKQLYAAWVYLACVGGQTGILKVIGDGLGAVIGDGNGNMIGTGD